MSLIKRIPAKAVNTFKGLLTGGVADMPDEMDFCESDCRKVDCFEDDWANCKRRQAALERRRAAEAAYDAKAEAAYEAKEGQAKPDSRL